MKEKILVVEDDVAILTGLVDLLTQEGYTVISTTDGERALSMYNQEKPDLVLLDIMIPEKSGYDVCKEIRKNDHAIRIIMLTAKGQEVDKVVGLELGADDYIVKPFGVRELLARVRAVLRRAEGKPNYKTNNDPIVFGNVTINPRTLTGEKINKEFAVTPREVHLLQVFLRNDNAIVDRFTLLDEVWGITYEGTTRTLDQHIAKLRRKIEDNPGDPKYITTVHGIGYRFRSSGKI